MCESSTTAAELNTLACGSPSLLACTWRVLYTQQHQQNRLHSEQHVPTCCTTIAAKVTRTNIVRKCRLRDQKLEQFQVLCTVCKYACAQHEARVCFPLVGKAWCECDPLTRPYLAPHLVQRFLVATLFRSGRSEANLSVVLQVVVHSWCLKGFDLSVVS